MLATGKKEQKDGLKRKRKITAPQPTADLLTATLFSHTKLNSY